MGAGEAGRGKEAEGGKVSGVNWEVRWAAIEFGTLAKGRKGCPDHVEAGYGVALS